MTSELTLGFDFREALTDRSGKDWTPDRRERFLLAPEIPHPLSVDTMVWTSAEAPRGTEFNPYNLWNSVESARRSLEVSRPQQTPVLIEIAVVLDGEDRLQYWEVFPKIGACDHAQSLLGYDVADRSFISGLSNCALSPAELAQIRRQWAGEINSAGLFGRVRAAQDFRQVCDRLIPEHAPFEAYRISAVSAL